MSRGPAWTPEADAELVQMMRAGILPCEIASRMDRTPTAIHTRCTALRRRGIDIPHAVTGAAARALARPVAKPGAAASPALHAKPKARRGRSVRPCMCCGVSFLSEGPHNRLCGRCRTASASPFDTPAVIRYR